MLYDLKQGDISSKKAGAEWIKSQWDPKWHDLIDRAWLGRHNPFQSSKRSADPDDLSRTVRFVKAILVEAQRTMESHGLEPKVDLEAA
jgi:hypothetical protein